MNGVLAAPKYDRVWHAWFGPYPSGPAHQNDGHVIRATAALEKLGEIGGKLAEDLAGRIAEGIAKSLLEP